jgi:hypothetical protein
MRIRLNDEIVNLLSEAAEPGESVQDTLSRLLSLRDRPAAYSGEMLTYADLAKRWRCSVGLVKVRVRQYRESGGRLGLGPVAKLGARKVLVPMSAVLGYEKGGVY